MRKGMDPIGAKSSREGAGEDLLPPCAGGEQIAAPIVHRLEAEGLHG
jgi:hypothetical protein